MKNIILFTSIVLLLTACAQSDKGYGLSHGSENDNGYANSNMGYAGQIQDSDWKITWKVKQMLLSENNLAWSSRFVNVVTNDGVVTLTGSVASQDDMDLIVRRVQTVTGVRTVNNQMTISNY